jgi:uncharacterized protein (TIGR02145 family)
MNKIIFSVFILFSPILTFGQAVGTPYIFSYIKVEFNEVTSITGRIWLDRNSGSDKIALNAQSLVTGNYESYYGNYYQWGRSTDGHEKYLSATTSTLANTYSASVSNLWNGKFIINSTSNWLTSPTDNLWQVDGINNPCPIGYRVPTRTEWDDEAKTWTAIPWTSTRKTEVGDAFASVLKLPAAGQRTMNGNYTAFGDGLYWSSTIWGNEAFIFRVVYGGPYVFESKHRANGYPVRCIKN